jgi:hypothetical protein
VEIRRVEGKGDRKQFLDLPYRLYATEDRWVPPLRMERKEHIDPAKNPFFEHAEVQFFLALRDGHVVGRISAHIDRNLNEFQDNAWGLFGFFECEDDPEAARALVDAAEAWLRERGRDRMVGPMDYTTNDECGLLIEGHERPPIILCPWQHAYYQPLLEEACGLDKAMDLLMWELQVSDKSKVHQSIWDVADSVEAQHGIVVRPFRKRDLQDEVTRFLEVYNSAWERNWGFVPLTEKEIRHYAKQLKPVLDENWAMIAERTDTGEVVGACRTSTRCWRRSRTAGCCRSAGWRRCETARRSTRCGCSRWGSSRSTSTPALPRGCTSCTSRRPSGPRRRAARWAGSSRPTRR